MDKVFTLMDPAAGGRFGNQVIAYCFAQSFAQQHGATLEVPENFPLRRVFRLSNPVCNNDKKIVRMPLDYIPTNEEVNKIFDTGMKIDLWGYYQNQKSIDFYSHQWIRENLVFQNWVNNVCNYMHGPYYACHMRRGDYVNQPERYCNITDDSFYKVIAHVNNNDGVQLGYILTEENPQRDKDGYCESIGLGWLPDFMCMVNSEILIRSNSTFSLVAGWFHRGLKIYSPLVEERIGLNNINFVEGNWPRCCDSRYHPVELTNLYLK